MTKHLIGQGGMTRRGLLKSGMAMTAAGLMLPAGMAMAQSEPKKGGTLRIGFNSGSTVDNYDPGVWDTNFVQVFAQARHNYLTEIAADGSLVGEVAESWEASPDAMTWTLKIRSGITFHSGGTVTADDVIASINYHRGPESTSAAKPIVDPIVEMKGGRAEYGHRHVERRECRFPLSDVGLSPADHARQGWEDRSDLV
jgi:peptide/nickel transport system substrate-binding protein